MFQFLWVKERTEILIDMTESLKCHSLCLMALACLWFLAQRVHFRLKNSRPLKLHLNTQQSKAMQLRRLKKETKWSDTLKFVKNHCKLYIGNPCRPPLCTYHSHFSDFTFNLLSRNCIKFICLGTKFEFASV